MTSRAKASDKRQTRRSRRGKPLSGALYEKIVAHVNRKNWWHVPPQDPQAYAKRGKFFASSFAEAEFWGRPLDDPSRVLIARPLVGDEDTIETTLFGHPISTEEIAITERWKLDAKIKKMALAQGYDSVLLMTPKAFAEFRATGKLPRSLELNIFDYQRLDRGSNHDDDEGSL